MTDHTWRILGLASCGLSLTLILILALNYRRPRPVSRLLILVHLLAVPAAIGLYVAVAGVVIEPSWLLGGVALGVLLGWWQGSAGRVYLEDGHLFVRNAGWYVVAWGITCTVGQGVAILSTQMLPATIATLSLVVGSAALWTSKAHLFAVASRAAPLAQQA
jgi:hypothetical protein